MNGTLSYKISLILAALSLVLVVTDIALISSNRQLQETANQRQAEINKGMQLSTLNQSLIQALGEAAVANNDTAAKELLAAQGITVKPNAAAKAP